MTYITPMDKVETDEDAVQYLPDHPAAKPLYLLYRQRYALSPMGTLEKVLKEWLATREGAMK